MHEADHVSTGSHRYRRVEADAHSHLPEILNRTGVLPAAHAVDGEAIRRGRIYVAPPGLQTCVHRGRLSVRRGPKENLHRPAIDPLFRTAAHHYGNRVIGVILTGSLDDGVAGLQAIKHGGGITVVQDPADASMPQMPASALDRVDVDHVAPADELRFCWPGWWQRRPDQLTSRKRMD